MLRSTARLAGRAVSGARMQVRAAAGLHLHEFQAKRLLEAGGLPVTPFCVVSADTDEGADVASAVRRFASAHTGSDRFVVKAQVHAGGRGLGHFLDPPLDGGVQLVKGAGEAARLAELMLGNTLVTKQTGAAGVRVRHVMVTTAVDIAHEYYFAVLLDRAQHMCPVFMASREGGVDIEKVAATDPDKIIIVPVPLGDAAALAAGAAEMAARLGLTGAQATAASAQFIRAYELFCARDATQVEINPLVRTPAGDLVFLDAKFDLDDNASFRQRDLWDQDDPAESNPLEVEAAKYDLNYIALDGSIGCMVNGAGLAMATCDLLALHGGSPANFLDVGGGATKENVSAAMRILQSDPKVRAILINIFGGIMRCDIIAAGVRDALLSAPLRVPLVVRLEGTHAEEGLRVLAEAAIPGLTTTGSFDEAARMAVSAAAPAAAAT